MNLTDYSMRNDAWRATQIEFVGKEPLVLWVVASLLFANTFLAIFSRIWCQVLSSKSFTQFAANGIGCPSLLDGWGTAAFSLPVNCGGFILLYCAPVWVILHRRTTQSVTRV